MVKITGTGSHQKQNIHKSRVKAGFIFWLGLVLLFVTACGDNTANPTTTSTVITGTPTLTGATTTSVAPTGTPLPVTTASAAPTATTVPASAATVPGSTGAATISVTQVSQPTPTPDNERPYFDRIIIVVLENADYSQAIAQPFLKKFAGQGVLLTNYSGVAHPSYPNYLAMVAGSTFGITSDGQVNLDKTSVMDLMTKKGISWKFYAQQYPAGKCFTGVQSGNYVRKHLPALSFVEIQKDPALCSNVVPATQFDKDISSNSLPDYSFYVPDLKNDGHDTGAAFASKWLEGFLGGLVTSQSLGNRTLVAVTYDESDNTGNNKIYTALGGPVVKPGISSDAPYNHYNLLRTVEDNFQLGDLGREDAKAAPITGIWQTGQ